MLKNYIKTALRSLWRHKGFSFLNIAGLAIGMSAFFLIAQYVKLETSYDAFVPQKDRIFRLDCDIRSSSSNLSWAFSAAPMAINLKRDYPEVEGFVRLDRQSFVVRRGDKKFQEDNTVMADSSLFRIFSYPLLQGDPRTALKEPFSLVLSRSTAKKYFGDANPLGQTLYIGDSSYPTRIAGVMKDLPENSSIKADLFLSLSTMKKFRDSTDYNWGNFPYYSYLLLKPGADAAALEAKMPAFVNRYCGPMLRQERQNYILSLEKLSDVYTSKREGFISGNKANVYIFSIVGLFILLVACINFVNLTTARSTERAKEVGVRKVVGAARGQLTAQFLGESLIITTLAFLLGLGLCAVFLPAFNTLAGKTVATDIFTSPVNILFLFLIASAIGLLAGIYPAIILSGFKPVTSLKGRFSTSNRGLFLRKSLVVVQFTVSTALIIGTFVVYSQLHYMRSRDLGFNKDQTLVVNTHEDPHQQAFRQQVLSLPGVSSAVLSGTIPGWGNWIAYSNIQNSHGGHAGRYFSKDIATDTMQAMIINEKALSLFGYATPQAAIGRKFDQWGKKGRIIGVIKDFHFDGLQQEIKPLSICLGPSDCKLLSVKLSTVNLSATIAAIRSAWNDIHSPREFDYFFLDEFFDRQYRSEERFGNLFLNFAALAILISCLGLLGLASYSTLQRTKEIGVRRVLGASITGVVRLLSADFLKLVALAFLISCPIAWFAMHRWLQDFAYRTSLTWWVFLGSGIVAVAIAFATIGYQAIKAATASPVKSLRSE